MSLILDALRRGRGRTTPRDTTNAAQTDAVLQTLGYGRFNTGSRLNKLKRIIGYTGVAIMFAVVLLSSGFGHRDVLLDWGASVGLRTTNGEWWRLATMMFVHVLTARRQAQGVPAVHAYLKGILDGLLNRSGKWVFP